MIIWLCFGMVGTFLVTQLVKERYDVAEFDPGSLFMMLITGPIALLIAICLLLQREG